MSFSPTLLMGMTHFTFTTTPCSEKVVHFVFERNFTTASSIFLQFSVTITEEFFYKNVILSKLYLAYNIYSLQLKTFVLYGSSIYSIYRIYKNIIITSLHKDYVTDSVKIKLLSVDIFTYVYALKVS